MHVTRTIHPPAGSNPVIVMLSMPGWHFLITPTLIGAVALVAVAAVLNNLFEGDAYPRYWF
jgi:CBS-domain-containing membrane protein